MSFFSVSDSKVYTFETRLHSMLRKANIFAQMDKRRYSGVTYSIVLSRIFSSGIFCLRYSKLSDADCFRRVISKNMSFFSVSDSKVYTFETRLHSMLRKANIFAQMDKRRYSGVTYCIVLSHKFSSGIFCQTERQKTLRFAKQIPHSTLPTALNKIDPIFLHIRLWNPFS